MTSEPIYIYNEAGYIIGIGYERPHFPIPTQDEQNVGDPGSCYFCHNTFSVNAPAQSCYFCHKPFEVETSARVLVFNYGLHIATLDPNITDPRDRGYIGPKRICAKCTDLVPAGSILDRG